MKFWQKCKLCYLIMKGDFSMTLVFILGLEMGLITPAQINPTDRELVRQALENLGKLDLLGE